MDKKQLNEERVESFFCELPNLSHHRENANKLLNWLLTSYKDFYSIRFEESKNCLAFIVTTQTHHRMRIEFGEKKMIIFCRWVIGDSKVCRYNDAYEDVKKLIYDIKNWVIYPNLKF